MEERFTVGVIVENRYGVLNRVAGLYGKRGYNIDSLAVGETEDPKLSRMTIVSTGDEYMRVQVVKQLNKLHDVKSAALLKDAESVLVEHLLIKLKTDVEGDSEIAETLNAYGGKVVHLGDRFLIADLTGPPDKVGEFITKCIPYGIIELCRSGSLALSKGNETVLDIKNL